MVTSKLPKELESTRRALKGLQQVTGQQALGQDDLNALKDRIRELGKEMQEMSDKRNVTSDPMEDKLTLFRQQAAIVARWTGSQRLIFWSLHVLFSMVSSRKKEGTAERLSDVRSELQALEEEVSEKREKVSSIFNFLFSRTVPYYYA